jgi:hypothetical protein
MRTLLRFLAAPDADVDEQIMYLRRFGVLFLLHQMRGNVADDTFNRAVASMNDHALGFGDGRVHAAQLADINKTLLVDVIHRHGDFVGVAGEHEPGRTAFVEHGDAVAVGIGEGLVSELSGIIQPGPLAAGFVTDGTWRVDQGFEESE